MKEEQLSLVQQALTMQPLTLNHIRNHAWEYRKEPSTLAANHKLSAASTVCLAATTQDEMGLSGREQLDGASWSWVTQALGHQGGDMGRGRKHLALERNFQYQPWADNVASNVLPQASICPAPSPIQMGSYSYDIKQCLDYSKCPCAWASVRPWNSANTAMA